MWRTPAKGWLILENGQLAKVKPVKMKPRMVQNNNASTAGRDAPIGLHFGSAKSHHDTIENMISPAVTTHGVS
jgi:hypothetical protein